MTPSPRQHAEEIKAWADGYPIEIRYTEDSEWVASDNPTWMPHFFYRVKPPIAYPETMMTDGQLADQCVISERNLANAAIRHAIDCAQVILPEQAKEGEERVARAVYAECAKLSPGLELDIVPFI